VSSVAPLCSSVWIHAFIGDRDELLADRCRGYRPPPPSLEECLLYAGHVGLSFEDERIVYGFLPDAPQRPLCELLNQLKNLTAFPGSVADHTQFFNYAAAHGRNVVRLQYLYPNNDIAQVRATIRQQQNSCNLTYAFPGVSGSYNCATWLHKIGLQIPESTGLMRLFMRDLIALLPNAPLAIGGCVV
jgi:hypothetical protein